jgi:hypothetical protein
MQAVEWIVTLLGSTDSEADGEVRKTKDAHTRFVYLKDLITSESEEESAEGKRL